MFDRFTDRAKKIMSMSRQAALRLDHDFIGSEHMLLGLLESDGVAANVLKNAGVDLAALRADFEQRQQPGKKGSTAAMGQLPFTPKAKGILEGALEEASGLGHNYIGSEHLLLSLLRAEDSGASVALRGAGLSPEAMRASVLEFLGEAAPSTDASAPRALDAGVLRRAALESIRARTTAPGAPTTEQRRRQRLLLISNSTMHGGGYLAHCADEIRDFLGTDQKQVAFVPYALADHDGYEQKAKAAFAALGHQLRSVHHAEDPCGALDSADAVFVGGGNTFRLLSVLYHTRLLHAIRQRVWTGMAYLGSSAGTNVATRSIMTTNDMPIVMPPFFDALSLVPFQINPHYLDPDPRSTHMGETREERLMQFHEENDTPVLALREGCMLRVEGDTMELRGTTRARLFCQGQAPAEFTPPCDLSFLLKTPTS